jgi:uncharacterized protein DUF6939
MKLFVANRRRKLTGLAEAHPDALILDVTSRASPPWVQLSPFYPHGGIPVPFSPGVFGESVEGIWQALKVFENADVDPSRLRVTSMKGLKRTVRKNGPVVGHRAGMDGTTLLAYEDARRSIYLPSYKWVLDNPARPLISELRALSRSRDIVLLDYTTNGEVDDLSAPLSHAALIVRYVTNAWPD